MASMYGSLAAIVEVSAAKARNTAHGKIINHEERRMSEHAGWLSSTTIHHGDLHKGTGGSNG